MLNIPNIMGPVTYRRNMLFPAKNYGQIMGKFLRGEIMAKKITVRPGIRCRLHDTRKHGVNFDRYWFIYHRHGGRTIEEGLGWSSQGWTEKKAAGVLAELQENQRRGERPFTLREKREIQKAERAAQEAQDAEQEKAALTVNQFWNDTYLPDLKANKRPGTVKSELSLYATWI